MLNVNGAITVRVPSVPSVPFREMTITPVLAFPRFSRMSRDLLTAFGQAVRRHAWELSKTKDTNVTDGRRVGRALPPPALGLRCTLVSTCLVTPRRESALPRPRRWNYRRRRHLSRAQTTSSVIGRSRETA